MYDVFVEADWIVSSDVAIDGATDAHALSADQQVQLRSLWGDEPAKCWDGADTGTCPGATDLRYRVNMHAFPGTSWVVTDDRAQEEIIKGGAVPFVRSHFFARANQTLRFYQALRYGFALHQDGNGVSGWPPIPIFQWGNQDQTDAHARFPFSHEAGHTFGLDHRHIAPQPLDANCGTQQQPNMCSWCTSMDRNVRRLRPTTGA